MCYLHSGSPTLILLRGRRGARLVSYSQERASYNPAACECGSYITSIVLAVTGS